jgi:hypothetical protein
MRFLTHTNEREQLNEMCVQIGGHCMLTHCPLPIIALPLNTTDENVLFYGLQRKVTASDVAFRRGRNEITNYV